MVENSRKYRLTMRAVIKNLSIFGILFLIILLFYGRVSQTWFQQDEWNMIGKFAYHNSQSSIFLEKSFFWNIFPSPMYAFYPLADYLFAWIVRLASLDFKIYAGTSLLLHTVNSYFVYILVKKVTEKNILAYISAFLFATSGIGQKAITWVIASTNTQGAVLFSLLAFILYHSFLRKEKIKYLLISILSCLMALLCKETAVALLLALPIYTIYIKLTERNYKKSEKFRQGLITFFIFFLIYIGIRYLLFSRGQQLHSDVLPYSHALNLKEYLTLILWSPIRNIVGIIFSPDLLYKLGRVVTLVFFPRLHKNTTPFDLFAETTGVDIANLLLFLPAVFLIIYAYKVIPKKECEIKSIFWASLSFTLSSMLVSIMLTARGVAAIIPIPRSRDLYLPNVGLSIILAVLIVYTYPKIKFSLLKIIFLSLVMLFVAHNYMYINNSILTPEVKKATIRKSIVSTIDQLYPTIPKRVVFYFKSDTPYYGSDIPGMPFQSGFGRTLLVWYTMENNALPLKFLETEFLYLSNSEGYLELNQNGFGYFNNYSILLNAIRKNKLPPSSIIAFSYSGKTNSLTDITKEVQKRVMQDLKNK